MKYISICSGIESATVAWQPLGFEALAFSEIERFPRAVLQHHYPDISLHGDFTTIGNEYGKPDILVGGTPCQSFSISGLRKGMDDERGNLALEYIKLAERLGAKWLVWENVPGVLSSNEGKDFGSFLGGLAELGYGFAYRVLDAQFYGVAQRRKRVFVIGYLGDWRPPAAVLFESESLSWNPPPSREKREIAPTIPARSSGGGGLGTDFDLDGGLVCSETSKTITAGYSDQTGQDLKPENIIAWTQNSRDEVRIIGGDGQITGALAAEPGIKQQTYVTSNIQVRRLTPVECARLQGFPDYYCRIPWMNKPADQCPDGHQYKSFGNSMAVPVMKWIGERLKKVDVLKNKGG